MMTFIFLFFNSFVLGLCVTEYGCCCCFHVIFFMLSVYPNLVGNNIKKSEESNQSLNKNLIVIILLLLLRIRLLFSFVHLFFLRFTASVRSRTLFLFFLLFVLIVFTISFCAPNEYFLNLQILAHHSLFFNFFIHEVKLICAQVG